MTARNREDGSGYGIPWPALGALVLALLIVVLVGSYGWDDGAITLAFSKTFAQTGIIALTPRSDQVEGFSSITWFLINAGIARIGEQFAFLVAAAQLATGVFFVLAAVYVLKIARAAGLDPAITRYVLWAYVLCGPVIQEIANGMEMALLTFAGLGLIHHLYFARNRALCCLFAVIFLATRFEAMVYYAFILCPLLFERRAKAFVGWAAFGLALVALIGWTRFEIFGELYPNTVIAKQHAPYREFGLKRIQMKLAGLTETVRVWPLLFAALAVLLVERRRGLLDALSADRGVRRAFLVLVFPILGVTMFNFAIGANWGYRARMHHLALPLILLGAGLTVTLLRSRLSKRQLGYAAAILALSVVVSWKMSAEQAFAESRATLAGSRPPARHYFGVTPQSYRLTGATVERVRAATGRPFISFMTADVGGLGLCCERIRIVDLGILANPFLARAGYAGLESQLARERPEIIEAHQPWSTVSNVYALPAFQRSYVPALVDNTRLYLRADIARALLARGEGKPCALSQPACMERALVSHRYVTEQSRADDAAFLRQGTFLLLD